jgi:hypothetical protein
VQSIAPVEPLLATVELAPGDAHERIHALVASMMEEPVDMERGPLCRLRLVRLGEQHHVLLVFVHHAIWDGASAELLLSDLITLHDAFASGAAPPPPEPLQYSDFAAWQRAFYESAEGLSQIAWWERHLEGAEGPRLPTDHPLEAVEAQRRNVSNVPFPRGTARLPQQPGLYARLQEAARSRRSTPYELQAAAFAAWLARRAKREDITYCSQHLNRHLEGTERLIGPFAQALVLRFDLSGDPSFAELTDRVRDTFAAARAHADVVGPFLRLARFRTNFNYFPQLDEARRSSRLKVHAWDVVDYGRSLWYDLTLHSTVVEGELNTVLWYNQALWEPATADAALREYGALLDAALSRPKVPLSAL